MMSNCPPVGTYRERLKIFIDWQVIIASSRGCSLLVSPPVGGQSTDDDASLPSRVVGRPPGRDRASIIKQAVAPRSVLSFVQNSGVPAHRDKPWALIVRQKTSSRLYWFSLSSTLPAYSRKILARAYISNLLLTSYKHRIVHQVRTRLDLELEIYREIETHTLTRSGSRRTFQRDSIEILRGYRLLPIRRGARETGSERYSNREEIQKGHGGSTMKAN